MKKLCFSLVCHEKVMIFGGYSSLSGRVGTPTCFPGSRTSFLRVLEISKILIFLNRKFYHGIFQNMSSFQLKPRYAVIIGNPIEIDSNLEITGTGSGFQNRKNSMVQF